MFTFQPFFINKVENVDRSRDNAYGACVMFLVAFFLSMIGLISSSPDNDAATINSAPRRHYDGGDYGGIPADNHAHTPGVLQDYAENLELPPSVQDGIYS
eukprot:CAMPEP_0119546198 /NCGR_PEP_ID=MMETSP1352-20130426/717_1 /TAXON_ID=265584 /ORGANISM="Stauroneis constricta, Strain CCMP1120" /LENGTH=99 /DNA_ID=CAMNT_0007590871 /DNA_START=197 /DNA_END=496 /DNA_ORIENTATION=-